MSIPGKGLPTESERVSSPGSLGKVNIFCKEIEIDVIVKVLLHSYYTWFYSQVGGGGGGYSGFEVTGMIEWGQKSKPPNIPRASNKTPKNPWTKT